MIIRVQSAKGTKKLNVSDKDNFSYLLEKVASEFGLNKNGDWFLSSSRKECDKFRWKGSASLSALNLKHGDLIYLIASDLEADLKPGSNGVRGDVRGSMISERDPGQTGVTEDELDQELAKMDGQIRRKRNEQLCHHPPAGQCIHCSPLEPYSPAYLEHLDPPVKFMPFHAYLRKLSGNQSKGKFTTLENLSCRVKPGCREHPPWPDGICTKCQPNPVTLDVQSYRHVDYVQFENAQVMERFLDYWRLTGHQRIGVLLGRYAHFDGTGAPPLAIKAVVSAIFEPPQDSTERSVKLTGQLGSLLPPHACKVAEYLGLRPVGWIFTDLVAAEPGKGIVKHYRGTVDSFFLSAEECITAAHLQNLHPNACRYSPDGFFGSKFVTVVVTGDASNQIHLEGYQVSNQGMALEHDHVLVPTFDAPELGYIRETTKEQFVPEVFYTSKDKYDNKVTRTARPLPVEFLLTDMPAAFPVEPVYSLAKQPDDLPAACRFPVENRAQLGQVQEFPIFAHLLRRLGHGDLYTCLANFHVLVWLAGNDSLPLGLTDDDPHGIVGLLKAVALASNATSTISAGQHNPQASRIVSATAAVSEWANNSSAWGTVKELADSVASDLSPLPGAMSTRPLLNKIIRGHSQGHPGSTSTGIQTKSAPALSGSSTPGVGEAAPASSDTNEYWACPHCTFHNRLDASECEMCRLPRV